MKAGRLVMAAAVLAPLGGLGLTAVNGTPASASAAPVNVPLTDPANPACPQADYIVVSPGRPMHVFLVVPQGPRGCPPGGLDMTINPDEVGSALGAAVALPLTADSCAAGTQLIDSEITALGQLPVVGAGGGPNSACPTGDAAFVQLQAAIAALPQLLEEEGIYYFFRHENGHHVLVVGRGATAVPTITGIYDSSPTPIGVFTLRSPGSRPALYELHPSAIRGVATVVCGRCRG